MTLDKILHDSTVKWLVWERGGFAPTKQPPKKKERRRATLARFYLACVKRMEVQERCSALEASKRVRALWTKWVRSDEQSLPSVIRQDGFLSLYAQGAALSRELGLRIWEGGDVQPAAEAIKIGFNGAPFFDVDATPPGILAKLFPVFRIKKDQMLLARIDRDLEQVSLIEDNERRKILSFSILSHGAAYRELHGEILLLPSFSKQGKRMAYHCTQHVLAEGIKTVSLMPVNPEAPPIYLCQGTEIWPSQPSVLASLLVNCAEHGSATEAYKQCRERLHHHLASFSTAPYVIGHSMGGALALQIGLYSPSLIHKIYAFNPPVPNTRDYTFYHALPKAQQDQIELIVNIDDIVFWRIGERVIGKVTLYLGGKRWRHTPIGLLDCLLLLPASYKVVRNIYHAFFSHQRIVALQENWISVHLTQKEIEQENSERCLRFDYMHFLPKFYDPLKVARTFIRRFFRWPLEKRHLIGEIERLVLHERELLSLRTKTNQEEIDEQIKLIKLQKENAIRELIKR